MGWEEGPDYLPEHPRQKDFDASWEFVWRNILKGKQKDVQQFIEKHQYSSLVKYCDEAVEFQLLAKFAWGYDMSMEEAEMLYYGEKEWLERNWPSDPEPDFDNDYEY